jgi:hypothetical protein
MVMQHFGCQNELQFFSANPAELSSIFLGEYLKKYMYLSKFPGKLKS